MIRREQVVNGTHYHEDTPSMVVHVLEQCRQNRTRIRVHYGDPKTGEDWGDTCDVTGYVGQSCGEIKVPLLVYNARSLGGTYMLDHCIVRITTSRGKELLFQHPTYHTKETV